MLVILTATTGCSPTFAVREPALAMWAGWGPPPCVTCSSNQVVAASGGLGARTGCGPPLRLAAGNGPSAERRAPKIARRRTATVPGAGRPAGRRATEPQRSTPAGATGSYPATRSWINDRLRSPARPTRRRLTGFAAAGQTHQGDSIGAAPTRDRAALSLRLGTEPRSRFDSGDPRYGTFAHDQKWVPQFQRAIQACSSVQPDPALINRSSSRRANHRATRPNAAALSPPLS